MTEGPQHPQKPDALPAFLPPPLSVFRALISVAGANVRALRPFTSPGFKPGLRCNEELGTPENLKWFSPPQLFGEAWPVQMKAGQGHRESYVQGEVPKAGQRTSAAGGDAWMFTQPVPGCVWFFALVPQGPGCTCCICTELSAVA